MKNTPKFFLELIFTLIVAFLLSAVVELLISFAAAILGSYDSVAPVVNFIGGTVFGVVFGFKLNNLIRQYKK